MENHSIESHEGLINNGVDNFRKFLSWQQEKASGTDENLAGIQLDKIRKEEKRVFDIFISIVHSIVAKLKTGKKIIDLEDDIDGLNSLEIEIHNRPSYYYQWMRNRIGSVLAAAEIGDAHFMKKILEEQPGFDRK